MTFKELNKEEFDNFALNYIPSTPYQTSAYGETMKSQGYTPYYYGMNDNGNIVAATMVLVKLDGKFKYGYVPRGYLIDYKNKELLNEFTINLRKDLNSKNITAIKISPMIVKNIYNSKYELISSNPDYDLIFNNLKELGYTHLGYNNYFEGYKPRFDALLELNEDYFSLFNNMTKQFKTKVRSSENNGVRIHKGTPDEIKTLYEQAKNKYPRDLKYYEELYNNFKDDVELYYAKIDPEVYLKKNQKEFVEIEKYANIANQNVMNNKGKSHQHELTKKMDADIALNNAKANLNKAVNLMARYPKGVIIATVLLIKTNNTITIMMDSFDRKYNSFNAKHLIIWKLIEKYAKEGYKFFNLGGITAKVDNKDKYYGLNSYKLGFGSKSYEYIGDLEFITNKPLYLMYKNTGNLFKKEKK
ncbi:MAG: peptidoglycan bridge formation glycyltransferase FemA/FemB family protein [Bacilli bacterium]|nr:peptidoglycan bridge formation glycyltransferase FemA/FemB family protein [Bacilli bacterium]